MFISNLQIGFGLEIPNKISLNIYISGCKNNKECDMKNCHNQELRKFKKEINYLSWYPTVTSLLKDNLINAFCLLGGEPLDQKESYLNDLINFLKVFNLPIYIYTGYWENTAPYIPNVTGIFFNPYKVGVTKQYKEL